MSGGAIAFMAVSWTFVLGLTFWCFYLLLTEKKHHDPDGIGPLDPPEPPHAKKK
ncbi:MAG: hypothetical protein IPP90_20815 [Gemmatimonadaceae bacterium]|nr:hypothetical protein [Gemmatimonadaceae bacterium]